MKILSPSLWLAACLLWTAASHAAQQAAVSAVSSSLSLNPTNAGLTMLTQWDSTSKSPLYAWHDDYSTLYNHELRPVSGAPGQYETGYYTFLAGGSGYSGYGQAVFTLPTTDADGDGVPDLYQPERSVNSPVSATITAYPSTTPLGVSGTITRPAGSNRGRLSVSSDSPGYSWTLSNVVWETRTLAGSCLYTRGASNYAIWNLSVTRADGVTETYTGSSSFTVPGLDQISLPSFELSGSTGAMTTYPATLTLNSNRYAGPLYLTDGYPASSWCYTAGGSVYYSWPDYTEWRLTIQDSFDSNANGIPDLSDDVVPCQFALSSATNALPPAGGAAQITISSTAGMDCFWTASNACPDWIVLSTNSGPAGAPLSASAAANTTGLSRSCALLAGGQTWTLTQEPTLLPQILAQPAGATVLRGAAAAFTVQASGPAPLSFQWYQDNTLLSGATTNPLVLPSVQPAQAGLYTVQVRNSHGSVTSAPAPLVVQFPPAILKSPASPLYTEPGKTISFEALYEGGAPLWARWQFNGADLLDNARIQGAATASLWITNTTTADSGNYRLVISNQWGAATSSVATLTVTTNLIRYTLVAGYNALTLPMARSTLTNAEAFVQAVRGAVLWKWDASSQRWSGHATGGANNFVVNPGDALFLQTTNAGTLTFTGELAAPVYSLKRGYNLISITPPHLGLTAAEALASSVSQCAALWRWDASSQNWSGHVTGRGNNFALQPGMVVLVYVSADSTW